MTLANGRIIGRVKTGDVDRLRFLLLKRFNYSIATKAVDSIPALVDLLVDFPSPTKDGLDRAAAFVQGFLDHDEPGPKAQGDTVAAYDGAGGAIREEREELEREQKQIPKVRAIGGSARDHFDATRLLVAGVRGAGFMVSYVAPGRHARKVLSGPLVPGPWASAFGCASAIDDCGGTKAQIEKEQQEGRVLRISLGDLIDVEGLILKVERAPNDNVELTPSAS